MEKQVNALKNLPPTYGMIKGHNSMKNVFSQFGQLHGRATYNARPSNKLFNRTNNTLKQKHVAQVITKTEIKCI